MRKYKDRDWLVQTYIIERLGTREIADMFGVSKTTIRKWMIKFDIPRVVL
jgi:transposase